MAATARPRGDITILDVTGSLRLGHGEEDFQRAASESLDAGRLKFIVNIEGVPYIDSAGISELVRLFVTSKKRGGVMKLANVGPRVSELLVTTKLLTVFETYDSEEAALASFLNPPVR